MNKEMDLVNLNIKMAMPIKDNGKMMLCKIKIKKIIKL
jgi:hypothetical protein